MRTAWTWTLVVGMIVSGCGGEDTPPSASDTGTDGAGADGEMMDAATDGEVPGDAPEMDAPSMDAPGLDAPSMDAPAGDGGDSGMGSECTIAADCTTRD